MTSLAAEAPLGADNVAVELRLFWGSSLLGMWHFWRRSQVTLGEGRGCDIFLASEGLPTDRFPLVRFVQGDYILSVTTAMEGELDVSGDVQPLTAYVGRYGTPDSLLPGTGRLVMRPDMRVLLRWGGACLALRLCAAPERAKGRGRWVDTPYWNSLIFALALHVAFVASLLLVPYDVKALQNDAFEAQPWREVQLAMPAVPPPAPPKASVRPHPHPKAGPGRPGAPRSNEDASPRRPAVASPSQQEGPTGGGSLRSLEGMLRQGNILGGDRGGDLRNSVGGLESGPSPEIGAAPRGPGPGSGLGMGPPSRGVHDDGEAPRGGGLQPGPSLGPRHERLPLDLETPRIEGSLSMESIRHVVDQQRSQVRYCYERALQARPSLSGRVLMRWVIGATGEVALVEVVESGLDDDSVARCLATKIRSWRFTAPIGGGTVEVRYPFVFRSAN